MVTIQVLGTGCRRCGHLATNAQQAVQDAGRNDVVEKITDIVKILDFAPMALPALAINGRVVTAGTLPSPEQIRHFIETSTESAGAV